MDITSIISIVIAAVVLYLVIRFIVSPILKAVIGIIIVLVLIYLLQKFLGFDMEKIFGPSWGFIKPIVEPANYYIEKAKNFLIFIWGNFPKEK